MTSFDNPEIPLELEALPGSSEQRQLQKKRRRKVTTDLPTYYYHTHFFELINFIEQHYSHVLGERELDFCETLKSLSFPAQCLYARLFNRRGTLFPRRALKYPEISNIDGALDELRHNGFVTLPDLSSFEELLTLTTRTELLAVLKQNLAIKNSLKKPELVELARKQLSLEQRQNMMTASNIVAQARVDEARFLMFLYFGKIDEGLSNFTLRDMGLVRIHQGEDQYEPRFSDREDAKHAWFFASRLERLRRDSNVAVMLAEEIQQWPDPKAAIAAKWRDQLALDLGRALEHNPEAALASYMQGESSECSERVIRLLWAQGRKQDAQAFLERCIKSPRSDEEALIARDIYARKFGKKITSILTDKLRAAATIDIDDAYRGAPEWGAALWFRARGHQAYKVENKLWRQLFGLLFWDLLFQTDGPHTYSPFERLPAALTERRFLLEQRAAITARLELLNKPQQVKQQLLKISAAHFGVANGIFRWRQNMLNILFAFLDAAPTEAIKSMLWRLCENYVDARHGYPDLLVIDDHGVRFIEIKSDGDQLRRNQLLRIEQLQQAGFRADILKVRWVLDPMQPYVVVDVETTGGRGDHHRVTEVGAVKVVNGEITDRFQSLINPQRNIPANITRLTGISNDMVANAPIFEEIADKFASFLAGSIFVAHNVEFDYGFINREFQRLGSKLRMPKLCTCASLRKLAPEHKRYGLAALAEAYDIPLETHHRALCDAEAAASLLLVVNEKRQALLNS